MKYKNKFYKKIKKSYEMEIFCGKCKHKIANYQKVGKGRLLRMHIDRVIDSNFDISMLPGKIICPMCDNILGVIKKSKKVDNIYYNMLRGKYNTKLDM